MKYSEKSAVLALIAVSVLFRCETAYAIPIPTIGAELQTQIVQLTKHVEELKKVKDQITNGIEQAKSMGDKMSMAALKNFATSQAKSALTGGMKGVEVPSKMKEAGFSDDVMKDPEKMTEKLEEVSKSGVNDGNVDTDSRKKCWAARESMAKRLSLAGLTNSMASQQALASGEDMKKAQEATNASDDQMQLLGANTAALKVMYQQSAASTLMEANRLASATIDSMCNY